MLPYSRGILLDNANNYEIVKTEAVFGFGPFNNSNFVDDFNSSQPMKWILTDEEFQRRSIQGEPETQVESEAKALAKSKKSKKKKPVTITVAVQPTMAEPIPTRIAEVALVTQKKQKSKRKKTRFGKGKGFNKCILKIMQDGEGMPGLAQSKKRKRKKGASLGGFQMPYHGKKMMLPIILGLLAAKSLLIPIALKALAFLSAKGLMMAFFSTVLASVISLKGMFNSNGYQNRKDEAKTQVEIIQVPTKSEDHVYYDDHYRRGDIEPFKRDIYSYNDRDSIPYIMQNRGTVEPYKKDIYVYDRDTILPYDLPNRPTVDPFKGNNMYTYDDYKREVTVLPFNMQNNKRNGLANAQPVQNGKNSKEMT